MPLEELNASSSGCFLVYPLKSWSTAKHHMPWKVLEFIVYERDPTAKQHQCIKMCIRVFGFACFVLALAYCMRCSYDNMWLFWWNFIEAHDISLDRNHQVASRVIIIDIGA